MCLGTSYCKIITLSVRKNSNFCLKDIPAIFLSLALSVRK